MPLFDTRSHSLSLLQTVFDARLETASGNAEAVVREILQAVRQTGDEGVLSYTRRFDFPDAQFLRVPDEAIQDAAARVKDTELWPILTLAHARIKAFHEQQNRQSWITTGSDGATMGQLIRPLFRVGVYVPGGTAAYPSTVLMTATPARVAGVEQVVLATPPQRETGLPPDATLAAAHLAGVSEVYAMGGAQAIGAMAYGTESVVRVDKIVGPGNVYVNLAKKLVYGVVGLDMLAGPSEVAVLADDNADPAHAAREILAQCEHDAHSLALAVSPSETFLAALQTELATQAQTLPRRAIVEAALTHSFFVQTRTLDEAADVINAFAPEHLHILIDNPWEMVGKIKNAGAILLGSHTSAPLGDYLAGPSHTLPTAGCARFASPLNGDDFVKKTSLLAFGKSAAESLAPFVQTFARWEGLEAHARAAAVSPGKQE